MRAIDRKLFRDLKNLRAQTVTIALLVACGVSLLISAWSAYRSLKTARDVYYRDYRLADVFGELKRAPNQIASRLQSISGIQTLQTRVLIDGLIDISGQDEPAVGRFISIPSGAQPSLNHIYLRKGRLPTDADPTEVVVHEGFAQAHRLELGDRISVLIQGRRESLSISGIGLSPEFVYALSPSAPLPDDRHFGVFWLPERGLERLAGMTDSFNNVTATLASGASGGAIMSEMDRVLKPYGNRGVYGREKQSSNMFVEDEISQQKASAFVMPFIFLGIAAFLIHVISSRLIMIHRSQIATLKAIGYSSREISAHYLKLVTLMMLSGTLPGIAMGGMIGRWAAKMYEDFFRFPSLDFSLSKTAILIGLLAGILPGIIGAWASIKSAFRLAPAEAMRPPLMPAYHATLFDRFGLKDRFGVPTKMVIRNLLLRPLRLASTVAGMSLALAIVVTSGFWMDTIRYMMATQFQRIQREDISVTFLKPISLGGLREMETLPSVLKVEGYRAVPVRLRYLNRRKELVLTGWPKDTVLRQHLDRELRKIELPENGVLLSRYFQKKWGIGIGESIELEILEGEQRSVRTTVSGFSDDLLGVTATMKIDNLWELLNEQQAYNVAAIKADEASLTKLYVKLKDMPEAAGVSLKRSIYQGFQQTIGKMIRSSTLVLIVFALAIALGVIYNSVRVSFSERAWEMASLRVMGFDRAYVFRLLIAEVALQVGLSIIPGCILGLSLAHLSLRMIHTETFGFPVIIEASTYAQATLVILAAFTISAWVVFRLTGNLSLADALKARE